MIVSLDYITVVSFNSMRHLDLNKYIIISSVSSFMGLILIIPIACCTGLRTSFPTNYILLFAFTICEGFGLGIVSLTYSQNKQVESH